MGNDISSDSSNGASIVRNFRSFSSNFVKNESASESCNILFRKTPGDYM